jgi:hypothetical protein
MVTSTPPPAKGTASARPPAATESGTVFRQKGRVSEDARIVELLIAAAEFATFSMDRLIRQFDDNQEQLRKVFYDYVGLVHGLEVTFLFPNITPRERELLVALMGARNALLVGVKGLRQWRTDEQHQDHDRLIRDLKNRFLMLRTEVVSAHLRDRLSVIQQRLLDREFLTIPTQEGHQTGFFTQGETASGPPPLN